MNEDQQRVADAEPRAEALAGSPDGARPGGTLAFGAVSQVPVALGLVSVFRTPAIRLVALE
jgi:hypothetical protein